MIDQNDKATQPIDLGPQPKRRGRPATGKAMSNAERQRAYRERQKEQRKAAEDRVKQLEMQVAQLQQKLAEKTKKRRHRDDPPIELQIKD